MTRAEALALCAAAEADHAVATPGPSAVTGLPGYVFWVDIDAGMAVVETNDDDKVPYYYFDGAWKADPNGIDIVVAWAMHEREAGANARTREPDLCAALRAEMAASAALEQERDHGRACADAAEQRATAAEAEAAQLRSTLEETQRAWRAVTVSADDAKRLAAKYLGDKVDAEAEVARLRALLAPVREAAEAYLKLHGRGYVPRGMAYTDAVMRAALATVEPVQRAACPLCTRPYSLALPKAEEREACVDCATVEPGAAKEVGDG